MVHQYVQSLFTASRRSLIVSGILATSTLSMVSTSAAAQVLGSWGAESSWYGWGYPYGWGGWGHGFGGASTVPGSIMEGWGYYLNGAGYYNRETAMANAINVNTWLRWSAEINQRQMQLNHSNYLRRLRRHETIISARQKIFERLRDEPNSYDVKNGDAINVKMRILMKPGYSARVAEELKVPVSKEILEQLVFAKPSEGLHVSLKDLSATPTYPNLLKQARYAATRLRLETSWSRALTEFRREGYADDALMGEVSAALTAMRGQVDADFGHVDQVAYSNARTFLKTRQDALRSLNSDTVNSFFQLVTSAEPLTLGQLLEALTTRSMQFYPADDAEQVATYERLYAVLRGAPSTVLSEETFAAVFEGSAEP